MCSIENLSRISHIEEQVPTPQDGLCSTLGHIGKDHAQLNI